MKKLGRAALWVGAFLLAFFVIKYAKQGYIATNAVESAQSDIEKMKTEAVAARPDVAPSIAFSEAAKQHSSSNLAGTTDSQKRLGVAADQFVGYYFVNTRTRAEYCAKLDVDIATFVSAFKNLHQGEYQITANEQARQKANMEWMYAQLEPTFRSSIEQGMRDLASQNSLSTRDICMLFRDKPRDMAEAFAVKDTMPALYAALHGR